MHGGPGACGAHARELVGAADDVHAAIVIERKLHVRRHRACNAKGTQAAQERHELRGKRGHRERGKRGRGARGCVLRVRVMRRCRMCVRRGVRRRVRGVPGVARMHGVSFGGSGGRRGNPRHGSSRRRELRLHGRLGGVRHRKRHGRHGFRIEAERGIRTGALEFARELRHARAFGRRIRGARA